jgi:hypothetical protein
MVDGLQVDRRRAEVAVAELALDDVERHAFAREFESVGMTQLMGREAASYRDRGTGPSAIGREARHTNERSASLASR